MLLCGVVSDLDAAPQGNGKGSVLRASLSNGLRVVIVRDPLAPVVTIEMNVLVGGNESPADYPGMAHALEHMAFRGCSGLDSDQTASIYAHLGGRNNASTDQDVTRFYATVPAEDLDVVLRAQAACTRHIENSEEEWSQERGAIEQEVAEDLSDSEYRALQRINDDMFENSPYALDALGSKASFDATTTEMLEDFQSSWYSPSNMILIIAGDVDPTSTLVRVRSQFEDIPSRQIPPHPAIRLQPVHSESFSIPSTLPNPVGIVAFRLPGTDSPDYAAVQVLVDILDSRRGKLYKLQASGQALSVAFAFAESFSKASVACSIVQLDADADPAAAIRKMRSILAGIAKDGVPQEFVDAAKNNALASDAFERDSIEGLADLWSDALADEGRNSPDDDLEAIKSVTVADVNRVARKYLIVGNSVDVTLTPSGATQRPVRLNTSRSERPASIPSRVVQLPTWADASLKELPIPAAHGTISDTTLPNGLRLIVRSDSTSPTIRLRGSVKHLELPRSKGDSGALFDVLEEMFDYGTARTNQSTFQKQLDDIAADETAGYNFSLDVLKDHFSRGVELLAQNELHPSFHRRELAIAKNQTLRAVAGRVKTPEYRMSEALNQALLPPTDPQQTEFRPSDFRRVHASDVRRYFEETLRPDLATIVIVGDVSPDEARTVIERWFGDWKAIGPRPDTTLPPVPLNNASAIHIDDPQALNDSVTLAEQVDINRFDPDYYPLQLADAMLGGNDASARLYHDLRQVNGYVYSLDVGLHASETRAQYSISFGAAPENIAKARAIIEQDLEEMRSAEVSAEELHQAKASLVRQIPLSEQSEEDIADELLTLAEIGLPLDEAYRDMQKYLSLNASDVRTAFEKRIHPENLVEVVRGPEPK